MEIGGAVIMVVVMVVGTMMMVMAGFPAVEENRGDDIHRQADNGDDDRFVVAYQLRRRESLHALPGNQYRHGGQDDRTAEGGQVAQLAGPEREARMGPVFSRKGISCCGDGEGSDMGGHVHSVGEQSHRSEQLPGDDLGNHDEERQADRDADAARIATMVGAEEVMVMAPVVDFM